MADTDIASIRDGDTVSRDEINSLCVPLTMIESEHKVIIDCLVPGNLIYDRQYNHPSDSSCPVKFGRTTPLGNNPYPGGAFGVTIGRCKYNEAGLSSQSTQLRLPLVLTPQQ